LKKLSLYALSYVIHHFYHYQPQVVFNHKTYVNYLLRNVALIISSCKFLVYNAIFQPLPWWKMHFRFYIRWMPRILRTLLKRWKPILGISYTRSVEYWFLRQGVALLDEHNPTNLQSPTGQESTPFVVNHIYSEWFFNQHHNPILLSHVAFHGKKARQSLIKVLHFLLLVWDSWPHIYTFGCNYTIMNRSYLFLRFFNRYYYRALHY
jgi:hypothetical protein